MARLKYGIRYPAMYAPEGAEHANEFNCVQRGLGSSLAEDLTWHSHCFVFRVLLFCTCQHSVSASGLVCSHLRLPGRRAHVQVIRTR